MRDMSALCHQYVPFGAGAGEVIVLDQGSVITPEAGAMLGALYSRSPASVRNHLEVIAKRGADKFMGTYYVGYGHKSIGDMGTAYVFIENVSLLAAKAVQDFPLYNGQECSTRYIDYGTREFIDPLQSEHSKEMLTRLRAFYLHVLAKMVPILKERYPLQPGEKPDVYEKAIKARAFDIGRAYLPGGASTNLVWSGELRQFADRLPVLRTHPLKEVREIGLAIEKGLFAAYPNSFLTKRYEKTETYLEATNARYAYFDPVEFPDYAVDDSRMNWTELHEFRQALITRPQKIELPYAVRDAGQLRFDYLLDFGSYRDEQRHRALSIRMPLLTIGYGFEKWYLDELTEGSLRREALDFLAWYEDMFDSLGLSPEEKQYLVPIGYRVPVRKTGDLRALVYFVELRATSTVHATLRARAQQVGQTLLEYWGDNGLVLHFDQEPNRFDTKRGTQDIEVKRE
jgi:thymidylate synthase ThyX